MDIKNEVSLTDKEKPMGKLSPDGCYRQESFRDGFPSGKVGFPYQSIPDGLSPTATVADDHS